MFSRFNLIHIERSPQTSFLGLLIVLVSVYSLWRIFEKAKTPGWICLIPLCNTYFLFDIVYGKGIKMLFLLIPLFNVYWLFITNIRLAKCFGKGTLFGLGLTFLSPVFLFLLAIDRNARYLGPCADSGALFL